MKGDRKGIVTIVGLVMFVILLLIFGLMFVPIWFNVIVPSASNAIGGNTIGLMMFRLIPAMFLLGIVISWFIYASAVK